MVVRKKQKVMKPSSADVDGVELEMEVDVAFVICRISRGVLVDYVADDLLIYSFPVQ